MEAQQMNHVRMDQNTHITNEKQLKLIPSPVQRVRQDPWYRYSQSCSSSSFSSSSSSSSSSGLKDRLAIFLFCSSFLFFSFCFSSLLLKRKKKKKTHYEQPQDVFNQQYGWIWFDLKTKRVTSKVIFQWDSSQSHKSTRQFRSDYTGLDW